MKDHLLCLVARDGSYDLEKLTRGIMRDLERSGYAAGARVTTAQAVQTSWIKLPGILRDAGATTEQWLVIRHFPIAFRAYDLPSNMAGKLFAPLSRGHTRGRDVCDLAWLLTQPPNPGGHERQVAAAESGIPVQCAPADSLLTQEIRVTATRSTRTWCRAKGLGE